MFNCSLQWLVLCVILNLARLSYPVTQSSTKVNIAMNIFCKYGRHLNQLAISKKKKIIVNNVGGPQPISWEVLNHSFAEEILSRQHYQFLSESSQPASLSNGLQTWQQPQLHKSIPWNKSSVSVFLSLSVFVCVVCVCVCIPTHLCGY